MHEMVNGMDLLDWYRAGMSGPYIQALKHSWGDDAKHVWNGKAKGLWRKFKTKSQGAP